MQIGVLILAAGFSKRMGENKALLKFDGIYSFLDQLISQYHQAGIHQIKIISQYQSLPLHEHLNIDTNLSIDFIKNEEPQLGRSYSIHSGLQEFKDFDYVFIQNIDNPFTEAKLIQLMMTRSQENLATIPQVGKKASHPILLAGKLVKQILEKPASSFDFKSFFANCPKKFIQWEDQNIRANINTPENYLYWMGKK
ncbi:MAG: NTP transferase domain-containing protein [Bacteroidales bacterium]|nr:NTP transferase domain-containing protein [Bacteroidales bacterium]